MKLFEWKQLKMHLFWGYGRPWNNFKNERKTQGKSLKTLITLPSESGQCLDQWAGENFQIQW